MTIKYSATPKLEKRRDKLGNTIVNNAPLLIDIAFNGSRFFINVGFRIDADKWDATIQKVKANTVHYKGKKAKEINDSVSDLLERIRKTFTKFELEEKMPTIAEFKQELNPKTIDIDVSVSGKIIEKYFFESFDMYVEQGKGKWQPNTVKKHNTAKSHLLAFDSKLTFEALNNSEKLDGFVKYLNEAGLRNTSAEKYLKVLKWFLKWAVSKKHTSYNDFLSYKPSLENIDKEIIFLSQTEFIHLYNLEIKQPYLDRVRDVFCFACVTGLRYSDIYSLKRSQIKSDIINVVTIKTNDLLKINLNKYSSAILKKYEGIEFPGGKALPVISNQKSNEYLKEVCELASFKELIEINYKVGNERRTETYPKYELMSFHAGRRTFVCLGLFLGLTSKVIMSFTGHKSIEAMKPYEKIVDELKSKEMAKFDF
jgi:integrase/gas vesicle protein